MTEDSTSSAFATVSLFILSAKMSSSSGSCMGTSTRFIAPELPGATTAVVLPAEMRVSLCWRFVRANSGTYSKMMEEFSRPYQRAGEPQTWRIMYLSSITRRLKPEISVSGVRTLRMRQKRKSPTLECSR